MHSARSQSASLFGLTLNNLVGVVSGTPGLGWLLPLGSHKVMGSFAGYIRSASELSKSFGFFFNVAFFVGCCNFMDCFLLDSIFFFHVWGPRRLFLAHSAQLFLCLKTSWLSLLFCRGLLYSFRHQKTFSAVIDQKRFFSMPEEDVRWMKKPDHVFHARRHRPRHRHREPRLVAPRTQIWLLNTHFPWQTKLWLSEGFSVRFNQHLLKQFTYKY